MESYKHYSLFYIYTRPFMQIFHWKILSPTFRVLLQERILPQKRPSKFILLYYTSVSVGCPLLHQNKCLIWNFMILNFSLSEFSANTFRKFLSQDTHRYFFCQNFLMILWSSSQETNLQNGESRVQALKSSFWFFSFQ